MPAAGPSPAEALSNAGLERVAKYFAGVSYEAFQGMTLADLGRLGITDPQDRQAVHKVAMALKAHPLPDKVRRSKQHPAGALELQQGGLIDLDADDSPDFGLALNGCGPALQLSPMGNDRPSGQRQVASANGVAGLDEVPDPAKITVVVRKRPMNKKEREAGQDDIVDCFMSRSCLVVNETKLKVDLTKYMEKHQFNFDVALDESVSNDEVYATTVQPLVHTLFRNGRASCFAYGQTGSGKTYTMSPLPIRAAADIIKYLALEQFLDVNLAVSCFEIYGNKVFDLLNQRKRLNILEDGKKQVVVVGLREVMVSRTDTIKQLIEEANKQRSVGSTAANADSSRSHSIMQFALKRGGNGQEGEGKVIGKISFIDLAGSERGADTYDNNRQTRLEGAEINKSLLALKECIRALDSDARHVPFRGSKLTAVLRDSFMGEQARTVMIANISPNSLSVEHTLNTLRYADRVKELRKDKAERAPGGVTPGEDPAYYAAVQRAQAQPEKGGIPAGRDKSPQLGAGAGGGGARPRTPSKDLVSAGAVAAPSARGGVGSKVQDDVINNNNNINNNDGYSSDLGGPDDDLLRRREELMDEILEQEEVLITAHRQQIEDTMDVVRKEMQLLIEVDAPGSAIDSYVERLDQMLQYKVNLINDLRSKLDKFKEHLQLEETLTKSIPPKSMKQLKY